MWGTRFSYTILHPTVTNFPSLYNRHLQTPWTNTTSYFLCDLSDFEIFDGKSLHFNAKIVTSISFSFHPSFQENACAAQWCKSKKTPPPPPVSQRKFAMRVQRSVDERGSWALHCMYCMYVLVQKNDSFSDVEPEPFPILVPPLGTSTQIGSPSWRSSQINGMVPLKPFLIHQKITIFIYSEGFSAFGKNAMICYQRAMLPIQSGVTALCR